MLKYVDICVDMKAGRKCKDALINYRNACQQVRRCGSAAQLCCCVGQRWCYLAMARWQRSAGGRGAAAHRQPAARCAAGARAPRRTPPTAVARPLTAAAATHPPTLRSPLAPPRRTQVNVGSLEEVIKYLLQVASARAEEASKAAAAQLDAVEDLEAEASPEEMMLSYVSGEKSKDRTDREVVTPWFKFLWETYRCGAGAGRGRGGGERGGGGGSSQGGRDGVPRGMGSGCSGGRRAGWS